MDFQNDTLADQIFQPIESPQIGSERVGETEGNLVTDACSHHSQTSGVTRVVSGDLTSAGRSKSWQSPKIVSRVTKVDDFWQLRARTLVVKASQRGFDD